MNLTRVSSHISALIERAACEGATHIELSFDDRGSRIEVTRNGRKIDIAPRPDSLAAPLFELIDYMHDKGDLPCALPELPPAIRASTLTTTSDITGRRASIEFTHPRTRG